MPYKFAAIFAENDREIAPLLWHDRDHDDDDDDDDDHHHHHHHHHHVHMYAAITMQFATACCRTPCRNRWRVKTRVAAKAAQTSCPWTLQPLYRKQHNNASRSSILPNTSPMQLTCSRVAITRRLHKSPFPFVITSQSLANVFVGNSDAASQLHLMKHY